MSSILSKTNQKKHEIFQKQYTCSVTQFSIPPTVYIHCMLQGRNHDFLKGGGVNPNNKKNEKDATTIQTMYFDKELCVWI